MFKVLKLLPVKMMVVRVFTRSKRRRMKRLVLVSVRALLWPMV